MAQAADALTHKWTLYVRGAHGQDLSYCIKKVTIRRHMLLCVFKEAKPLIAPAYACEQGVSSRAPHQHWHIWGHSTSKCEDSVGDLLAAQQLRGAPERAFTAAFRVDGDGLGRVRDRRAGTVSLSLS